MAAEPLDLRTLRRQADLRSPRSFDHVGRDVGSRGFVAGAVLADLADEDPRIVCASADLKYVTQMAVFEHRHPDRFFQFGIAERNMITAAAGMATCGLIPYVSTFASFSAILAYEAIRTDLAYPGLPVRILATHAGISMGFFGTSHHATEDLAALRAVAGLTVLSPPDATATEVLLRATVDHPGPVYLRLSRGREPLVYEQPPAGYGVGAPHLARPGGDVLLVATGIMVGQALAAARELAEQGIEAAVLDVHTIKPFPAEAVAAHAAERRVVVCVEEHTTQGGLGTMTAEAVAAAGAGVPVRAHGLQDEYALIGPPLHLYRYYGLDAAGIATVARRAAEDPARGGPLWTAEDRRRVLAELGVGGG
jgi:transketolase